MDTDAMQTTQINVHEVQWKEKGGKNTKKQ